MCAHVVVARGMIEHENDPRRPARGSGAVSVGAAASVACKAPTDEKSRSVLRHCTSFTGSKAVRFERLHQFRSRTAGSGPLVPNVPSRVCAAGAAGDLGEFGRIELAVLVAVEFAVGGKGDVIDVEIEPHADGVGRDQIIDFARLVEFDLGVARARRQRAEHHGRAAALAADQFGDGIDFIGRERDDGASGAAGA